MNVNFRLRKIIFLNYFVFHLPKEQQENQSAKLQKDFYLEQEDAANDWNISKNFLIPFTREKL